MRSNKSLGVALLGLAAFSYSFAEGFSGELRMDSLINRQITGLDPISSEMTDRLYLSRARLRYEKECGSLKRWTGRMEFHLNELTFPVFKQSVIDQGITTDKTRLAQANVAYKRHRTTYRAGLIEAPNLTPSYEHFTLGIDSQVGSIIQQTGYHLGVMASFKEGPFAGEVAVWQARPSGVDGYRSLNAFEAVSESLTPSMLTGAVSPQTNLDSSEILKSLPSTSFSDLSIPYGIGGRVNYTLMSKKNHYFGSAVGASYGLLGTPLVLGVLYEPYVAGVAATDTTEAVPAQGYYRTVSFSEIFQITSDLLRTYENTRFGSAFSMQWIPVDQVAGVLTTDTTGGDPVAPLSTSYVFEDDGLSFGYYVEAGILMKGEGYKIDRAKNAVSGIRLGKNAFGWEIGTRIGVERTTNMLSLLNLIGVNDFKSSVYEDTSGAGRYIFNGVQTDTTAPYTLVTIDNTGEIPYVIPYEDTINSFMNLSSKTVTQSFKTFTQGWAAYINVYPAENTVLKMQFEYLWHEKQIYERDGGYVNSINYQRDRNIQFRIESFF